MAPHVLVIPFPAQGHINPLIRLSEMLSSKGILVTFINTESNHSKMMKARSYHDGISVGPNSNIRFAQVSDGLPLDFNRTANRSEFFRSVMNEMRGSVEDLIKSQLDTEAGKAPFSCIIGSSFPTWTFLVAKKFELPFVAFWPQSLSVYTIYRHLSIIISKGHYPPKKEDPKDMIDYIPGLPPLQPEDLPSDIQTGDTSSEFHRLLVELPPLLEETEWIIGNTVYELEREASDGIREIAAPIYSLGPFLPSVYLEAECKNKEMSINPTSLSLWAETDCSQWLDSKARSSVLYVSFGSMALMSKTQVEEIAMGLLESEQTFLWVVRPGMLDSEKDENDHGGVLPEGFLEKTKNQALVVPWSTQLSVLSHPSVGGFFTHGGWNSTMESLSLGVPMIVFPQGSDQSTNRMLVVNQWKIGLRLETCRDDGVIERGEIARAAKSLLGSKEGEEMRGKSKEIRETIRQAASEGGSSWINMQRFVDYIGIRSTQRFVKVQKELTS